jgi:hypothetical protein
LVARSKYFIFRKRIISTIPQKYTEMMGGDWTTIATTFDCHYESMESWVEMKNVKTPTSI